MTDQEPVCIATYPDEVSAELAAMWLEEGGIGSFVVKDDCGGMLPYLQAVTGVRLMVRASDAEPAAEILTRTGGTPE